MDTYLFHGDNGKDSVSSDVTIITVADIVYKCFVPGVMEWLKEDRKSVV